MLSESLHGPAKSELLVPPDGDEAGSSAGWEQAGCFSLAGVQMAEQSPASVSTCMLRWASAVGCAGGLLFALSECWALLAAEEQAGEGFGAVAMHWVVQQSCWLAICWTTSSCVASGLRKL